MLLLVDFVLIILAMKTIKRLPLIAWPSMAFVAITSIYEIFAITPWPF